MQSKKIAATVVLSLVVVSLLISGCTTSTTSNQSQVKQTQTAQLSMNAQYQGQYTAPSGVQSPDAGNEYVKFSVTVKNLNVTGVNYLGDPFNFKVFDTNNRSYNASYITTTPSDVIKTIRNSKPGDSTAGSLVFEVKQGFTPQQLVYTDSVNSRSSATVMF